MKKIIISLFLALGLATSSYAISLEGLSIGISGSMSGYYAVGTENDDNGQAGVEEDTKEAGAFESEHASLFVEYSLGPISLGLNYILGETTTPQNTNVQIDLVTGNGTGDDGGTNQAKAEFENHTTLYALFPIPADGPLGNLYLKAGMSYVDINTLENLGTGGSYGNVDTTGYTAGIGLQIEAADGLSLRAEVMAAEYDDVSSTNSSDGTKSIQITDMMSAFGTISLVKTF